MIARKDWIWGGAAALLIVALGMLVCGLSGIAKADRAGQTIEFLGHFRDDDGVAAVPTSGKFIVYVNGVAYDSSSVINDFSTYRDFRTLRYQWTIPSLDDSSTISCIMRGTDATITDDEFLMSPTNVVLRAAMTDTFSGAWMDSVNAQLTVVAGLSAGDTIHAYVDSIAPSAINDLWTGIATSTMDTLTAGRGGLILSGETPIIGARVNVTRTAAFAPDDIIGYGNSDVNGDYRIHFPISPTAGDTVYVWAWYQGTWQKQSTQVVVD